MITTVVSSQRSRSLELLAPEIADYDSSNGGGGNSESTHGASVVGGKKQASKLRQQKEGTITSILCIAKLGKQKKGHNE